jgi:hypothetical protein
MTSVHPIAQYVAPLNVGISEDEKKAIIDEGLKNLESGKASIIGFSGKKGAGKDTLAQGFIEALNGNASMTPISTGIKNEASEMIAMFYSWIETEKKIHEQNVKSGQTSAHRDTSDLDTQKQERHTRRISTFAKKFNTSNKHAEIMYTTVYRLLKSKPGVTGYSRDNEVIALLQFLGKDVRQPQDEVYWTRKMLWNVLENASKGATSLIPDIRFLHDANSTKECGGYLIRADIEREEQLKRLQIRDGVEVSNSILDHPSETSLDDYNGFDLRFNSSDKSPEESFSFAWNAWKHK